MTCGFYVAFEGIISFSHVHGSSSFLSHDADGAINYTIAFVMLRWLFRGIILLLVPVLVPVLASVSCAIYDALMSCDADGNDITQSKSHIVPYFDHLDLRNAVLPLIRSSSLHDANASSNGIAWPRRSCYISFQLSWSKECIGAKRGHLMLTPIPVTWHDTNTDTNAVT